MTDLNMNSLKIPEFVDLLDTNNLIDSNDPKDLDDSDIPNIPNVKITYRKTYPSLSSSSFIINNDIKNLEQEIEKCYLDESPEKSPESPQIGPQTKSPESPQIGPQTKSPESPQIGPQTKLQKKPQYRKNALYVSEYIDDTKKLLIKTNISNILNLINDSDEPIEIKQMINILKNMLILHNQQLQTMSQFIKNIEGSIIEWKSQYDKNIIYKMLYNIKKATQDNIHFRYVNENIRKYPPIPIEERIVLEKKLKFARFSYQVKKKHEPFQVGQIVGAKDKEMKWWLSRILHVHNEPTKAGYWYYIRFEGWGPMHDEWIYSETYRVRWFNPRKHFLKK